MTKAKYLLVVLLAVCGLLVSRADILKAADLSQFKPGNIITDAVFFNGNSMSTQQIQYFLNSKVPTCDTNGEKTYTGSSYAPDYDGDGRIERWERGKYTGNPKPYICLKNYAQSTPSMTAVSGFCGNLTAKTNSTAAAIIKDVSSACGVSPKVLIVLLQKEQGLVADDWPWPGQYAKATGFRCPDTAACDPAYKGFFYQVYSAAYQFKKYAANSDNYNYVAGQNNQIPYHPGPYDSAHKKYYGSACYDSNGRIVYGSSCSTAKKGEAPDINYCGYKTVYIANQATAGLYNYTPYVPNQASLNAGYGSGDKCSSYGNRNFYSYFVDWFGSTQIKLAYTGLVTPRWMQARSNIQKHNIYTGELIDSVVPAGTKIYFPKKVNFNGSVYLQTSHDNEYGLDKGILLSDLSEVPVNYEAMTEPRWLELKQDAYKYNPVTEQRASGLIPAGTKIYYKTKFSLGNYTYLRTVHDEASDLTNGFRLSDLKDTALSYQVLSRPRWLQAKNTITETDLTDLESSAGQTLSINEEKYFNYKLDVNGATFVTGQLPNSGEYHGFPLTSLSEINTTFTDMLKPRWMTLPLDISKVDPVTGQVVGPTIPSGTQIYFAKKLLVGGITYLQTRHDTQYDVKLGIPLSNTSEISLVYQPMQQPRIMRVRSDLRKQDPITEEFVDSLLKKGTQIKFTQKIDIGGVTYLRTEHDQLNNVSKVIPLSKLSNL